MDSEHSMSDAGDFYVSDNVRRDFEDNGYIIVRGLLTGPEVGKLRDALEGSEDIQRHATGRDDGEGRTSKLTIWNRAGNDVAGVVSRVQKVAGTMQALLGGDEIYHYHSKLMMKNQRTGGKHVWHQDYGYWYQNGCLFPDMGSIFIPVDKCTKENGCLQVLKGSHRMGRIDHVLTGEQAGAEAGRLSEAFKVFRLVFVQLDPGDVLFFHCNLIHSSDKNDSGLRRWVLITSVNKRSNNPTREHHNAMYHPMKILPNAAIMECQLLNSTVDKEFVGPESDSSALSLKDKDKPK